MPPPLETSSPAPAGAASDALVFFGATGDLAYKQIFPALQQMVIHGELKVPVIGVAKAGWTLEQLKQRAHESLSEHGGLNDAAFAKLTGLLQYIDGDYQDPATFEQLRRMLGSASRPTHYLAIPPSLFGAVVEALGRSDCAKNARVVVEKPFGRDLKSAQELNAILTSVFAEDSIFRIDHFLGKEAVENLLFFRFANSFLEPIWDKRYIHSVQITMAEQFGIQGRGKFYDEVGAIRDVVQNHLLQVLGFLAMAAPTSLYPNALRDEEAKVFRTIVPLTPSAVVRGQFAGYHNEPGVAPDSRAETFAAVRLNLDSWRWSGVPFLIRAGKCLPVTATEVVVRLRESPLWRVPFGANYVRFRLNPDFGVNMGIRVKRPGFELVPVANELSVMQIDSDGSVSPYERLLTDAMRGDGMLFVREDAIEAAWSAVDGVTDRSLPLQIYQPGTWGPPEAQRLADDIGGWHNPE
ncbi:MAG: glucose-6-phosphate dehydrogenase [Acidobacteriota bacterium]